MIFNWKFINSEYSFFTDFNFDLMKSFLNEMKRLIQSLQRKQNEKNRHWFDFLWKKKKTKTTNDESCGPLIPLEKKWRILPHFALHTVLPRYSSNQALRLLLYRLTYTENVKNNTSKQAHTNVVTGNKYMNEANED